MRVSWPVTNIRTREEIRASLENELDARVDEEMKANRLAVLCENLIIMTNYSRAIACIKIIRLAFDIGLKDAKDAYDAAYRRLDTSDDLPF